MVLLRGGEAPEAVRHLDVRVASDSYDDVVALIEWSDKVVAW